MPVCAFYFSSCILHTDGILVGNKAAFLNHSIKNRWHNKSNISVTFNQMCRSFVI